MVRMYFRKSITLGDGSSSPCGGVVLIYSDHIRIVVAVWFCNVYGEYLYLRLRELFYNQFKLGHTFVII